MFIFFCRKPCCGIFTTLRSFFWVGVLVCSVSLSAHAGSADLVDAGDRWQVCAGSATAPAALGKIAARVAARLGQGQGSERVQVRLVPQAEGSTEVLLAATTELIDQLRARLVANRVPLRTVDFQWLSEQDADPHWEKAEVCRGVMVRFEVTAED